MRIVLTISSVERRASRAKLPGARPSTLDPRPIAAFTMVEIAISLAVIGIALVAIIGTLPVGLRMQRENREQTLINQDATVLMEHIRNGANGQNLKNGTYEGDLTNYVYAITNAWMLYNADGTVNKSGLDGYTYQNSSITSIGSPPSFPINNDSRIVGLMSLPEYTDRNGNPLPGIVTSTDPAWQGCFSNHVVAYIRSFSGAATEKPPQDNALLRDSSLSYRVVCQNLPTPMFLPAEWQSATNYARGAGVYSIQNGKILYWRSLANGNTTPPGSSSWERDGYTETKIANCRELRLTFLWPQLPNGNVGKGHWTYRASVAGELAMVADTNASPSFNVYFFQPQSFTTNAP